VILKEKIGGGGGDLLLATSQGIPVVDSEFGLDAGTNFDCNLPFFLVFFGNIYMS